MKGLWKGFWDKVKDIRARWEYGVAGLFSDDPVSEEFFGKLEEHLLAGDVGVELTENLLEDLRGYAKREKVPRASDLRAHFAQELRDTLLRVPGMGVPLSFPDTLGVILLVGVNGSGKTTTAAKLAARFRREGRSVFLAAADTFRAAAIDQLRIWGERTGTRVIAQTPGSDAAAVVFDALQAAKAAGGGVIVVDTAGRLHTKHNLMEELAKIHRVVRREVPQEAVETLLVLDAVTGQNGLLQAQTFHASFPLTGFVLTKFDHTARGGILLSLASRLELPVRYVGLGEREEDLEPFDVDSFVEGLLALKPQEGTSGGQ